jgi:hypothetical protein
VEAEHARVERHRHAEQAEREALVADREVLEAREAAEAAAAAAAVVARQHAARVDRRA